MSVHINAKLDDVAPLVLMPGDPLRAKYIAEKFLDKAYLINSVRNMLGYTGFYKGKKISVIPSGMGIPSMGIYSYELFSFYNVEKIIRIGTCGAYDSNIKLRDIILVNKAYTDSNFSYNFNSEKLDIASSNVSLNNQIINCARKKDMNIHCGNILTSEIFYANKEPDKECILKKEVLGVEMESFALFYIAKILGKEASCLLTVSDCIYPNDGKILTSKEREQTLDAMIEIALDSVI